MFFIHMFSKFASGRQGERCRAQKQNDMVCGSLAILVRGQLKQVKHFLNEE